MPHQRPAESAVPQSVTFSMTRLIEAPRARVWDMHSQARHLEKWWGPAGCTLEVVSLDFRPGGMFHYAMHYTTGATMWGRFVYRDITPGDRLVYVSSFANAEGGIARAPFSPVCPLELLNTLTFADEGDKTRVRLHVVPFGANAEEIAFFKELCNGGLQQGFGGTYGQLDAYLKSSG